MVTDTMLFLAIRQNNWDEAIELATKLTAQNKAPSQQALYNAVGYAASGDVIAQFLLTILAGTQWNS